MSTFQIGAAATDKVGFSGATPVVQPTSANQAAVAVHTLTTAATQTSPWGFATAAQANQITTDLTAVIVLLNQLRADLVALGLIKGS